MGELFMEPMAFIVHGSAVFALLLAGVYVFFMIRKHWYLQTLLGVVMLGSVVAAIWGFRLLHEGIFAPGTALAVGGLAVLLIPIVVFRKFFVKSGSV